MARTRGAKSSSPSNRKRGCEGATSSSLQPSPSRPNPPPVQPATKAADKTIFNQVGGRPLQKKPRVESSNPSI
ncbi:hypothetical protein AAG906_013666 [Vitis piasezkii]